MLSNEPLPHGELPLPFAIEILRCIDRVYRYWSYWYR